MKKTFVLNDENITNSYGFRVLNAGIDLERFKQNPVMLANHWNSTDNVIGRWDNIRIEGSQLLADAVFDESDEDAKKIASKVEGGFLKGCSMGIRFSREFMEERPDETYLLTKSVLYEVSIVAVPSNANSVRLYSESGELMDDQEVKLSLQHLGQQQIENQNHNQMSKIALLASTVAILSAFGLQEAEAGQIDSAVAKLKAELDAEKTAHGLEKTKREQLEQKAKEAEQAQFTALLDQAITDGAIVATQRESFVQLGYAQAKTIIEGLPKRQSLAADLSNGQTPALGVTDTPKSLEDFQKLSADAQLKFKNEQPQAYQALFVN